MEAGHLLLGPRVAACIGALGAVLMFWFPEWPVVGVVVLVVGAIPLLQWSAERVSRIRGERAAVHYIPLAVSTVQLNHFANYAFNDEDKDHDSVAWAFRAATFTNISRTDALVLDITLRITSDDGTNIPLSTDAADGFGRRYGTYRGKVIASYLSCPLRIAPQHSVKGQLAFLFTPFDQAMRAVIVDKMLKNNLKYTLEVFDHVSGRQIAIELPGSYRGRSRSS